MNPFNKKDLARQMTDEMFKNFTPRQLGEIVAGTRPDPSFMSHFPLPDDILTARKSAMDPIEAMRQSGGDPKKALELMASKVGRSVSEIKPKKESKKRKEREDTSSDEEIAKRLQAEYDEEARANPIDLTGPVIGVPIAMGTATAAPRAGLVCPACGSDDIIRFRGLNGSSVCADCMGPV